MTQLAMRAIEPQTDWPRMAEIMRLSFGGNPEDFRANLTDPAVLDATIGFTVDGELAALAAGFDHQLVLADSSQHAAKFGSGLMLHPDHRGKGLGGHAIELLIQRFAAQGAKYLVIEGGVQGLYQRAGFDIVGYVPQWQAPLAALTSTSKPSAQVRKVTDQEAASQFPQIELDAGGFQPGRMLRGDQMWWYTFNGSNQPTDSFVIEDDDGKPIGHFTLAMGSSGGNQDREKRRVTLRNWWTNSDQGRLAMLAYLKRFESWFDGIAWVGGMPCPLSRHFDVWPQLVSLRPIMVRPLGETTLSGDEFVGGWFNELCP